MLVEHLTKKKNTTRFLAGKEKSEKSNLGVDLAKFKK
jgi:hypothetical protein